MSFWNRRKQSRRAAAATLDALEPRRLLAFEVGMGGAWSPAAIDEGGGVATFHVDRYDYDTGDYSQPLTVNLAVRGWDQGGASPASADDLAFPATVTFAPGEWQTSFDVTAVDDLLPEPDEHYEMYVLPGSGYTTDPAWSRQSAIFASDTPNVWVEAAQPTATEGGQAAQVTFRRDNTNGPLTARFGLTGDVADVAAPGVPDNDWLYSVAFADGQAAVTVPLTAIDDSELESPEQVSAYLVSNAYGTAGVDKYFTPADEARPHAVAVTIADDEFNAEVTALTVAEVGGPDTVTTNDASYEPDIYVVTDSSGQATARISGSVNPSPLAYGRCYYRVVNADTGGVAATGLLSDAGTNVLVPQGNYRVLAGGDNNHNGALDDNEVNRAVVMKAGKLYELQITTDKQITMVAPSNSGALAVPPRVEVRKKGKIDSTVTLIFVGGDPGITGIPTANAGGTYDVFITVANTVTTGRPYHCRIKVQGDNDASDAWTITVVKP